MAPPTRPLARPILLALLLAGFALRLVRLGADSLWYDETVSVALAQMPVSELVARTAGDIHPPGYYLLLHLWQAVTAPAPLAANAVNAAGAQPLEFLYAFTSLAASLLALALLAPLGRRLAGERATLIGVALAAVNPFAIWYAQEVRMYAVAGALGLLCLWATLRWMETGRARHLLVYVLAAAAGMWTLYYFGFLLAGVVAAALLLAPNLRRFWIWLGAQAAVLLLYAPWLPVLWRQATDPPVPPWRAPFDSAAALLSAGVEALAAPTIGQVQMGPPWLWALV
ncbi:MAG: glycosyltransferase family 39 protein, partial [Caldilineaceae bacterium]